MIFRWDGKVAEKLPSYRRFDDFFETDLASCVPPPLGVTLTVGGFFFLAPLASCVPPPRVLIFRVETSFSVCEERDFNLVGMK